ncbi:MAG: SusC/RagA family TonB-linked outer membrane protein, partial [Phaeodactylibacter sp.]|nr:SusC/RagA family TonB-linked outer membrane protein [Phaeodactylibacter sp.]
MKHALALLLVVGMTGFAAAQRTVSGVVTDAESGEALIGANILVVGTSTGTATDFDGKYSLNVPDGSSQIEVSYTGYSTQVITLGASDILDIQLAAGDFLEEVVVVGYGSVKKSDATGAVATLTSEDFNVGIINSPEQLIQGRAAGVQITSASGEPGAGVNVRIRGTSSVRGGNNPLFVVDGVPLAGGDSSPGGEDGGFGVSSARNPLNFLNPNDIASIDILKDASATAIYGSRGANGVVIITTKKGKDGKGRLNYDYSLGIANITKKYDLLTASEFLSAYGDVNGAAAAAQIDGGAVTDWQDEILRTGLTHNHNVSYGGGDETGDYLFSFGYMDQEGILKESGLTRYTGRFNANKKFINDRLQVGTQLTVANTHDDNVPITNNSGFEGDLLGSALKLNPTLPVYDDNGDPLQVSNSEPNPVALLQYSEDYTNTLRALGSLYADLEIMDGLNFRTVIGFDQSTSNRTSAFSRDLNYQGIADIGRMYINDIAINNRLWENYFTYDKQFGTTSLNAVLGYSYQQFITETRAYEFTNFRTSDLTLMINNFASADQSGNNVVARNSTKPVDELQSYFGRINLGFADSKYLFTATLRADGSTRFAEGNQYGYFPSAAFKWRLIEEDFVPDVFDDLGLRVGYGITGNQEIPYYIYGNRCRYADWDIDRNLAVVGGQFSPQATPNEDLKWESTTQINVGLDFAFWDTRFSGSVDWYRKNTNDLLVRQDAAQPSATTFVWRNLDADIINTGVEVTLNVVPVDNGDFRWDVVGNVAFN